MIKEGICLAAIVVNLTGPWTKIDQLTLDRAKVRCSQLYPESPCLKKLIKKSEDTYNAICGERHPQWLSQADEIKSVY